MRGEVGGVLEELVGDRERDLDVGDGAEEGVARGGGERAVRPRVDAEEAPEAQEDPHVVEEGGEVLDAEEDADEARAGCRGVGRRRRRRFEGFGGGGRGGGLAGEGEGGEARMQEVESVG